MCINMAVAIWPHSLHLFCLINSVCTVLPLSHSLFNLLQVWASQQLITILLGCIVSSGAHPDYYTVGWSGWLSYDQHFCQQLAGVADLAWNEITIHSSQPLSWLQPLMTHRSRQFAPFVGVMTMLQASVLSTQSRIPSAPTNPSSLQLPNHKPPNSAQPELSPIAVGDTVPQLQQWVLLFVYGSVQVQTHMYSLQLVRT